MESETKNQQFGACGGTHFGTHFQVFSGIGVRWALAKIHQNHLKTDCLRINTQLVRPADLAYESKGRVFDSLRARHLDSVT